MKKKFRNSIFVILFAIFCLGNFISCASTKVYNTDEREIIPDEEEAAVTHYIKEVTSMEVKTETDKDLVMYNFFEKPFLVLGYTVRETGRVAFYTTVNVFSGLFSYYAEKDDGNIFGFVLPNLKEANKEYDSMMDEYHNTPVYIYREYIPPLRKAEIKRKVVHQAVDWNEETKNINIVTDTVNVKADVAQSRKMLSKKASIIGSTIGKYTSYVVGIPGWFVGFILGYAIDNN